MLNNILILSNEFVEEKRDITMVGTRLFYSFLRRVDRTEGIEKQISIPIKEFCDEWGLREESNYVNIIRNIRQLAAAVHERQREKQNGHIVYEAASYFRHLSYDTETKAITGTFNDMLKSSFLVQQAFTKIDFRVISGINNRYGIRLYELLKQYEKFGVRRFTIHELKKLLGIGEDKYKGRNDRFEETVIKKGLRCIEDVFPEFGIVCTKEGRAGNTAYTFEFGTLTLPKDYEINTNREETVYRMTSEEPVSDITDDEITQYLLAMQEDDTPPGWSQAEIDFITREMETAEVELTPEDLAWAEEVTDGEIIEDSVSEYDFDELPEGSGEWTEEDYAFAESFFK